MTVTEQRRQGLADKANEVFGSEHGSTFMELVSQPPWEQVATKADVALLRDELAQLRERWATKDDLRVAIAELEVRLQGTMMRWFLGTMTVQTAVIGLLLAIT